MKKRNIFLQVLGLAIFCFMAAASSSSQGVNHSSGTDWGAIGRSALIGAGAGHDGYDYLGVASTESKAKELAASMGYSRYIWDTNSGNVYGK